MGLMNIPRSFQKFPAILLHKVIGVFCFVYVDDIPTFSQHDEEHSKHLGEIDERLWKAHVKISHKKSNLEKRKFIILGYKASVKGIDVDEQKTKAIKQIRALKTSNK